MSCFISFADNSQGGQSSFFLHVVNTAFVNKELPDLTIIEFPFNLGSLFLSKLLLLKSIEISFPINFLDSIFMKALLI